MVGWVCFKVMAEAGTVVTLQHAEVLEREGDFYTRNLRFERSFSGMPSP
jgi:alpha-L-rhamnosidase